MPSETEYAQWRTDCPACGKSECLIVAKVTLWTGLEFYPRTKLEADGFEAGAWKMLCDPRYEKNESTENEQVCCSACQTMFTLSDLALAEELRSSQLPDGRHSDAIGGQ